MFFTDSREGGNAFCLAGQTSFRPVRSTFLSCPLGVSSPQFIPRVLMLLLHCSRGFLDPACYKPNSTTEDSWDWKEGRLLAFPVRLPCWPSSHTGAAKLLSCPRSRAALPTPRPGA